MVDSRVVFVLAMLALQTTAAPLPSHRGYGAIGITNGAIVDDFGSFVTVVQYWAAVRPYPSDELYVAEQHLKVTLDSSNSGVLTDTMTGATCGTWRVEHDSEYLRLYRVILRTGTEAGPTASPTPAGEINFAPSTDMKFQSYPEDDPSKIRDGVQYTVDAINRSIKDGTSLLTSRDRAYYSKSVQEILLCQ